MEVLPSWEPSTCALSKQAAASSAPLAELQPLWKSSTELPGSSQDLPGHLFKDSRRVDDLNLLERALCSSRQEGRGALLQAPRPLQQPPAPLPSQPGPELLLCQDSHFRVPEAQRICMLLLNPPVYGQHGKAGPLQPVGQVCPEAALSTCRGTNHCPWGHLGMSSPKNLPAQSIHPWPVPSGARTGHQNKQGAGLHEHQVLREHR